MNRPPFKKYRPPIGGTGLFVVRFGTPKEEICRKIFYLCEMGVNTMKKVYTILVCLSLIFLSSCSTSSGIHIENGAYSCTPQEFIDDLNQFFEEANVPFTIPSYKNSGDEIPIGDGGKVSLTLDATDDGRLNRIQLDWYMAGISEEESLASAILAARIPALLSPANFEAVGDELNFLLYSDTYYYSTVVDNGTYYDYSVLKSVNSLVAKPA